MPDQQSNDKLIASALSPTFILQVITVVGALGGSWALMRDGVSDLEVLVEQSRSRIEKLSDTMSDHREFIARLQEQITTLREQVTELRRQSGLRDMP